ncbi:MAG TPA: hypothetical protein PKC79_03545 [Solidesulfovibrio magneticus]|nr:hypothetical protein [Solidesulfovibrio magneticus]
MADPPYALTLELESPGTRDGPGLSCFEAPTIARFKTFIRRLLSHEEQQRLVDLFYGPRAERAGDKRLLALGLARKVLGKVVASPAARKVVLRDRFEVRRGSHARHLAIVAMLEADTDEDALSTAWAMARRDVGSRWRSRLVLTSEPDTWTIALPPPRAWPDCTIRPYVLCLLKLPH